MVELEKCPVEIQDFKKNYQSLSMFKKNNKLKKISQKMLTCPRLETLSSMGQGKVGRADGRTSRQGRADGHKRGHRQRPFFEGPFKTSGAMFSMFQF